MGHMQDLQIAGGGLATDDAMQASMRVIDKLREDADFWRRAEAVQVAQVAALKAHSDRQAKELAELMAQVANLKASNVKLRSAQQSDTAALIDHALNFEGSTLVLCTCRHERGTWVTLPVVDIDHARKVMAEDLANEWGGDGCTVCAGTGEGQREGAACTTCGGKG